MTDARIVVGVDGSDGSRRALRWAIEEAQQRGAALEVVHVWANPGAVFDPYGLAAYVDPADIAAGAKQLLDDLLASETSPSHASVVINPVIAQGHASHRLVEAAEGAAMLVVGSRGRGGFAGMLLGSTSQQCSHHARCPVVIIR